MYPPSISLKEEFFQQFNSFLRRLLCIHPISISDSINLILLLLCSTHLNVTYYCMGDIERVFCLFRYFPDTYISLLSHPGHQRLQLPPLNGTGVTLCSIYPNFYKPGPCILGG